MRILIIVLVIALAASACSQGITIQQAANGRAKCHRNQHIRN